MSKKLNSGRKFPKQNYLYLVTEAARQTGNAALVTQVLDNRLGRTPNLQ